MKFLVAMDEGKVVCTFIEVYSGGMYFDIVGLMSYSSARRERCLAIDTWHYL